MAFIIPFLGYIAAGVGAAAAVSQGQQQKKSAYVNAQLKEQQAQTVENQTIGREELQRTNARKLIGDQLAIGSESGVELSGSRADILQQSMYNAELDALNIRYEGKVTANNLRNGGTLDKYSGDQAASAGYLNAASSLMSGASGYLSKGNAIPANQPTYNSLGYLDRVR